MKPLDNLHSYSKLGGKKEWSYPHRHLGLFRKPPSDTHKVSLHIISGTWKYLLCSSCTCGQTEKNWGRVTASLTQPLPLRPHGSSPKEPRSILSIHTQHGFSPSSLWPVKWQEIKEHRRKETACLHVSYCSCCGIRAELWKAIKGTGSTCPRFFK